MEKAKDFLGTNKKILMIISGVIVALVAFVVGFMLLSGNSKEKELKELLEGMSRDFYENFYYDGVEKQKPGDEKIEFLERYSKIGIKLNLDNLSRYNTTENEEKIAEFVNPKTGKPCDKEKTRAIIYPKENYNKTDYTIELKLACGFENEETKE